MRPTLVDTDILSEIFRGRNANVAARAAAHRAAVGAYAVSVITIAEVVRGLQQRGRSEKIVAFVSLLARPGSVRVLTLDGAAAELAGRIAGDLDRTGQTVGLADPLIAASALRHGLVLATGNTRHYERIVALGYPLDLHDWRQS